MDKSNLNTAQHQVIKSEGKSIAGIKGCFDCFTHIQQIASIVKQQAGLPLLMIDGHSEPG
jgi:hypothetical protein